MSSVQMLGSGQDTPGMSDGATTRSGLTKASAAVGNAINKAALVASRIRVSFMGWRAEIDCDCE